MKALILGGTGAIGKHLVDILANNNIECSVTSRKNRQNKENILYIKGNALDDSFLNHLLTKYWDVIIDFMIYDEKKFSSRINTILSHTDQYIFLSSSRVYADTNNLLKEDSPRLLDSCNDKYFLKSNEYSLLKAKEENILINAKQKNWTIIRPYLTYSNERLQLGSVEKESWIYRALHGRTIVFSEDIGSKYTTLTYGYDVAYCIAKLVGNKNAIGEIFHVTSDEYVKWKDILNIYIKIFEENTGKKIKVLMKSHTPYDFFLHTKYDRLYNRRFDNSKLKNNIGEIKFMKIDEGLKQCLSDFLIEPKFNNIDWKKEATSDRLTGEKTPLSEIPTLKNKFVYMIIRYLFTFKFLSRLSHIFS